MARERERGTHDFMPTKICQAKPEPARLVMQALKRLKIWGKTQKSRGNRESGENDGKMLEMLIFPNVDYLNNFEYA